MATSNGNSIINDGSQLILEDVTCNNTYADCGIEVVNLPGGEIQLRGNTQITPQLFPLILPSLKLFGRSPRLWSMLCLRPTHFRYNLPQFLNLSL
jgi:hypothetical protein